MSKRIHPIKTFVLTLLCLLNVSAITGQHLNSPLKSIHDKREFIIGLDNRITKINDRLGMIYGIYSGLAYGENLRVKLSISGTPFRLGNHDPDQISRTSRLVFMSVGQEFDFLTINRFKITAYANAGYGYHFYRVIYIEPHSIEKDREEIVPLELGLHGRYQINELFAFKVGGGWRFVFPDKVKDLNGPYLKLTAVVNPKKLGEFLRKRRMNKQSVNG